MRAVQRLASTAPCAGVALLTLIGQLGGQQQPAAGARPPGNVNIRREYVGLASSVDGSVCPGARQDGRVVVDGKLSYFGGGAPTGARYDGVGRVTVDIDECDVKPGAPEENPYCVVRYVATYDARISFHATGADDSERGVSLVWRPRGPVTAKVTGTCLPDFIARRQREVTERGYGISSAHTFEFAAQIAPNGIPRAGRHEEPIGDNIGHEIWTIGTGPEDDVRITITGPSCACLEGEVAAPKVTDFTARASTGGGAFGKWVVTPEGDAPRQLVNSGGATATLSLGVTRTTTRFTVAIAYTRDGRTYQSGPHTVTVCVVDSISTPDGAKDISFDDGKPGRAVVALLSRATVAGRAVSDDMRWTLEPIEDGTTLTPSEATGEKVSFTYETLPEKNTSFGVRKATMQVEAEGCTCARASNLRIFYAPFATNHPQPGALPAGGDAPTPNWFYYWMQTSAGRGVDPARVVYRTTIAPENIPPAGAPPPMINGRYEESADRVLIAGRVPRRGACRARMAEGNPPRPTGVSAIGIDCFAETLRHEWRHRVEYRQWWSGGYDRASDLDGDRVPNGVEEQEPGCNRMDPLSCQRRPFPDVTDRELTAYWVGWTWPLRSADAEDWTCLGKQWRGKVCPIPGSLPQ